TYHEAKLIDFYKFFAGVEGRRVLSHCSDTDIQQVAFRKDSTLILLFHNQSDVAGSIDLRMRGFNEVPRDIMIRRTGRSADFRPFFSEAPLNHLNQAIAIGGQESMALFITYDDGIPEQKILDEKIYYSRETSVQFTGAQTFSLSVPDAAPEYAILRVGLSRPASLAKEVEIRLNGTLLSSPVEDCADRITGDDYATTKIIKVDAALIQANNTVQVSFPDGKEGGVGAVVLRVGVEDASVAQIAQPNQFPVELFPNPSHTRLNVRTHPTETLMIYNQEGKLIRRLPATGELTSLDISNYPRGLYHLHLISETRLRSSTFKVSP
ncbi:MAG: T9SS type A sorting domain-containing protein, partial [Bacteroidota bacterium]